VPESTVCSAKENETVGVGTVAADTAGAFGVSVVAEAADVDDMASPAASTDALAAMARRDENLFCSMTWKRPFFCRAYEPGVLMLMLRLMVIVGSTLSSVVTWISLRET
jgi:hypothetical protein